MGSLPSRTATAECAIGASLKVRVDVIYVSRNIWIAGKALHDRRSTALAVANDAPEGFDFRQVVDERRAKRGTHSVRPVAVVATRVVAPIAIIGPRVDLAVQDLVKPPRQSVLLCSSV
jgi:hypothetical protein